MNNRQIAIGVFLALGAVAWFVTGKLLTQVTALFGVSSRVPGGEAFFVILPLVVGGTVALFLVRNPRIGEFMEQVISELKKVSWPSQKEVIASTIVAIAIMIIAGIILGLFDTVWSYIFKLIL